MVEVEIQSMSSVVFVYELLDAHSCENGCVPISKVGNDEGLELIWQRIDLICKGKKSPLENIISPSMFLYNGEMNHDNVFEGFKEQFNSTEEFWKSSLTKSGLYLFKPTIRPIKAELEIVSRTVQIGPLVTSMRTEYSVFGWNDFKFTYTVEIYNSSDSDLFNSVKTISEIENPRYLEVALWTHLPFEAEFYTDNGYSIEKWKIYSNEEAKTYQYAWDSGIDMLGLNGFASVHGSLFTNNDTFYGFTNSHSALLLVHNTSMYEIMLQRSTNF